MLLAGKSANNNKCFEKERGRGGGRAELKMKESEVEILEKITEARSYRPNGLC